MQVPALMCDRTEEQNRHAEIPWAAADTHQKPMKKRAVRASLCQKWDESGDAVCDRHPPGLTSPSEGCCRADVRVRTSRQGEKQALRGMSHLVPR